MDSCDLFNNFHFLQSVLYALKKEICDALQCPQQTLMGDACVNTVVHNSICARSKLDTKTKHKTELRTTRGRVADKYDLVPMVEQTKPHNWLICTEKVSFTLLCCDAFLMSGRFRASGSIPNRPSSQSSVPLDILKIRKIATRISRHDVHFRVFNPTAMENDKHSATETCQRSCLKR